MDNLIIMELPLPEHRATMTIEAMIEADNLQLAIEKAERMLDLFPFKNDWKIRKRN